jgi:hypothetical protein
MKKVDSLDELRAAFNRWRRKKRHVRERVPDELWARALQAAHVYGTNAVARATKIENARLRGKQSKGSASVPAFTCLDIAAPAAATHPIAEVETTTGLKLRIFAQTPETLGLLSSLCGIGGAS